MSITSSNNHGKVFLTGLALSCLIAAPGAVDLNLSARTFCLALTLLFTLYFLGSDGVKENLRIDIVLLSYFGFNLFSLISVCCTINGPEAFYTVTRDLLAFSVFLMTIYFLKTNPVFFKNNIYRISVFFSLISVCAGLLQMAHIPSLEKINMYSVTGLNAHKNLFSSFLFLNLFFLVHAFYSFQRVGKIVAVTCLVLNLCLIVLLQSKAVWLAGAITVAVFFICYPIAKKGRLMSMKRTLIVMIALLIFLNLLFLIVLPKVFSGVLDHAASTQTIKNSEQFQLDNERLTLWNKTCSMIAKHPFGVGPGNWQIYFPDETLTGIWRAEDLNVTFQRPHNDLLWILSEYGLIGFNLFLIFVLSLMIFLFRLLRSSEDRAITRTSALSLSFISGYLVIAFCDFPKERIEHNILINIIFAFAYTDCINGGMIPVLKRFKQKEVLHLSALAILCVMCIIGFLRYQGESYTKDLYESRNSNNHPEIIRNGERALSFAYDMDPTSVPIYWYVGNAYAAKGDNEKAFESFEKAYRSNPYNRNVLNDLASILVLRGDKEKAKNYYAQAMRISPRFDEPKLNMVAVLIGEKKYAEANKYLKMLYHDSERRNNYQRIVNARPQ